MITSLLIAYSIISSIFIIKHEQKNNELVTITEDLSQSIVSLQNTVEGGRATGFVTDTDKGRQIIVTNAHVCEMGSKTPIFQVSRRNKHKVLIPATAFSTVIAKDDQHDLCIVSMPIDLKAPSIKLAKRVELDSKFYIVGYPTTNLLSSSEGYVRGFAAKKAPYNLELSLCVGAKYNIEKIDEEQEDGKIIKKDTCFFQGIFLFTDATSDKGASGSPGLNSDGEVVGVMSMVYGNKNFAHLVPLSNLKEFLSKY